MLSVEDRLLLRRHLAGDAEAFARLVDLLGGPVLAYLRRCGLKPEDRDDVFQDVFSRIHRAADSYQPERALKPWVFTITVNAVRTFHRRRQVRQIVQGGLDDDVAADQPDGLELVEASRTAAWLEGEIARLPLAQREALLLCCVQRLEQAEVAAILDVPVATVKTRLRRARLALIDARHRRDLRLDREIS